MVTPASVSSMRTVSSENSFPPVKRPYKHMDADDIASTIESNTVNLQDSRPTAPLRPQQRNVAPLRPQQRTVAPLRPQHQTGAPLKPQKQTTAPLRPKQKSLFNPFNAFKPKAPAPKPA